MVDGPQENHEESAAYHATVAAVAKANRRIWKTVALALIVVVLLLGATVAYLTVEVDAIRSTQRSNTAVTHCQNRAFDQVLGEALSDQPLTAPPKC